VDHTVSRAAGSASDLGSITNDIVPAVCRAADRPTDGAAAKLNRIALIPRVATHEVQLCGYTIPAGKTAVTAPGAINRDPTIYRTPKSVDVTQSDRGHLAFGAGIHRCIGSHRARLETGLVVEEFHQRIPDYASWPGLLPGSNGRPASCPTTISRWHGRRPHVVGLAPTNTKLSGPAV
jgi:hypothetical protein